MNQHPDARNLLANESSPYLRQHADNPVHWRPWGEKALEEARTADKPILLSIGYAACHWCHVMAHESFENEAVAAVMNELFVNVKVDREERPDIDQIYMAALNAMGEHGGWPMTMFLDPEGRPFWGGTYFPPERRYGRPGFVEIMRAISKAWHADRESLLKNGAALKNHLEASSASGPDAGLPTPNDTTAFATNLLSLHDREHGGIRGAPKFPNAPLTEVWLRAARCNARSDFGQAFLHTIERMSQGGIYDHLGGGLSRYSVDDRWLVPHFEKMLYDNAHYLRTLVWAWKLDQRPLFRTRIEETIGWAVREMRMPGGAFASSLDADSEGEEGKFYVWSESVIDAVLGPDAPFLKLHYGVTEEGNFEGHNILNRLEAPPLDAEGEERLSRLREKLLEAREKRIRPGLDDKILADWNGYFIRALAEAAFAFNLAEWLDLAETAFRFIAESMNEDGKLSHSWREGISVRPAMATDYGAMINAALTLYEVTGKAEYLDAATAWQSVLDRDYADGRGSYFLTSSEAGALITRPRANMDEANPSGASQILEGMVRLATLAGDQEMLEKAWKLTRNLHAFASGSRYGIAGYFNALDTLQRQRHVTVQARDHAGAESFLEAIRNVADPALTFAVTPEGKPATFFGAELAPPSGAPRAILCTQQACSAPMAKAEELAEALAG
ncbi:MAG: thioredoxin domain-containing protein [Nitratireductor sp.]|nr:thioredoxin domain-containing protein [Nitratireductor sp.]